KATEVKRVIPLDYDLGLLMASDINVLDDKVLGGSDSAVLNQYLRRVTREGAQLLINQMFDLPTNPTETSVLATLPEPKMVLPREKHVPKPKPKTRWERFAEAKGIKKQKRSAMVFDEATEEYKPRWGSKSAKNTVNDWAMPLSEKDDPFVDPRKKVRDEKKERMAKNQRRQRRNQEEAELKERMPSVDPRAMKKQDLQRALTLTKTSTASLGKFDQKLKDEPRVKGIKRKFKPATDKASKERETSLGLLKQVIDGPKNTVNVRKAVKKTKV
ncbi:Rhodanese- sulfurtransferase, partial [Dimargaris xerosporica]